MRNRSHFIIVSVIFLLILNCCAAGSPRLTKKKYPEGFSLRHPESWQAQVVDDEYIWISSRNPDKNTPFILIHPFFLLNMTGGSSWLRSNLSNLQGFFKNAGIDRMERIRDIPEEWVAGFRCERSGKNFKGLALCSIHEKSGILYVIAAEEDEFEGYRDELVEMLESFQFEALERTNQNNSGRPKIEFTDWQDPLERAFSLRIPKGWKVEGGTFRRASVDLIHVLLAVSPDQKLRIQFNDSRIPIFTAPSSVLSMAGFQEGSWYSPGYGVNMMVKRYTPGRFFLTEYIQQNFVPHVSNFEVISQEDRPDVVSNFNRLYSQFMNYGISFTLHAGEMAFCFDFQSVPYVGYGLALTQVTQAMGMEGGTWSVALMAIYTCPASEDQTVRYIAEQMFQSVKMNPQWVASQQQLAANVSQIVTQTNQEISNIINNSYWARQNTMDNIHRRFSNYILGVTDVVDPATGDKWKVEAGHNYYWRKDHTDQIVGTDTFERPDINFSFLKEY